MYKYLIYGGIRNFYSKKVFINQWVTNYFKSLYKSMGYDLTYQQRPDRIAIFNDKIGENICQ